MERWATFDCYGTLIDWNGGIRRELARVFAEEEADWLLQRYHRIEPRLQESGRLAYREVLTRALEQLAEEEDVGLPDEERDSLVRSLPAWEPFREVPEALEDARARGWRLAILSNSDADLIEASKRRLGIAFEATVVASEIGSYKPGHAHWEEFFRQTNAPRDGHVHVAASLFHDIAPANELGLRSVWINRLGGRPGPEPTRELTDLEPLPATLDELVPS